ncbi:MAG: DUF3179 domain-containing protein [Acidobacteria bacterium]|nr:MAG: DUF3179 domain-containing protein [Acidobacteriota bacterium]
MFRAAVKGRVLQFDTAGADGGNEVFRDRQTGSRWLQSTASAISGPLKGTHLELYPFQLTKWSEWRRKHPQTQVLQPLPGYAARLGRMNQILDQGIVNAGGGAPKGAFGHDDRLPPRATIVGLEAGGVVKAYAVAALNKTPVVNDQLGSVPVLLVHQPASDTTTAFIAEARGRHLHFQAANPGASRLRDRETHSLWNAYGVCLSGRLRGARLRSLILEPEFWFAWSEFHPGTKLYKEDSPQ